MIPVYVTYYGRRQMLDRCVLSLALHGLSPPTIIDNTGTLDVGISPLLRWPCEVVRGDNRHKHHSPWHNGIIDDSGYYIVTEEDVMIDESCPLDVLDKLRSTLEAHPEIPKLGLRIRTDVPHSCEERWSVSLNHERAWNLAKEIAPGVIDFPVDTHFAMHRPGTGSDNGGIVGARLDAPYLCQHQPWHNPTPTAEELAYYDRVGEEWRRTHIGAPE